MSEYRKKPVFKTALYYIIVIPLVIVLNVFGNVGSGPCNPGLGDMSFLLVALITVVLLIVNSVLLIRKGRAYLPSVLVHLLFVLILVVGCAIEAVLK
jgi:hypothetical protein